MRSHIQRLQIQGRNLGLLPDFLASPDRKCTILHIWLALSNLELGLDLKHRHVARQVRSKHQNSLINHHRHLANLFAIWSSSALFCALRPREPENRWWIWFKIFWPATDFPVVRLSRYHGYNSILCNIWLQDRSSNIRVSQIQIFIWYGSSLRQAQDSISIGWEQCFSSKQVDDTQECIVFRYRRANGGTKVGQPRWQRRFKGGHQEQQGRNWRIKRAWKPGDEVELIEFDRLSEAIEI